LSQPLGMFWTLTGSLSRRFWTRCARLGVGPTEHIAGSACFSGGLLGGRRPERQQDLLHLLPRREDRVDVLVRPGREPFEVLRAVGRPARADEQRDVGQVVEEEL